MRNYTSWCYPHEGLPISVLLITPSPRHVQPQLANHTMSAYCAFLDNGITQICLRLLSPTSLTKTVAKASQNCAGILHARLVDVFRVLGTGRKRAHVDASMFAEREVEGT